MACRMEASWRAGASSRLFPLARFCCSGTRTRPGTDERAWSRLRGKRLLRRAPGANGSLGRLVVHPRFGVAGELDDLVGKLAVDEIGQGDGFEDGPHAGADGDPDVLQVFGGAGVLDGFGPLAADVREGPLDGAYDAGEPDLIWRQREPVAARGAALRPDEARALEVMEDVLHELVRDALGVGDPLALEWPRAFGGGLRQLGGGPERVVRLGRDLQAIPRSPPS